DRHFRDAVRRGAPLRVRTCRPLAPQAPQQQPARPATPLQRFLMLYDANDDGALDGGEIDALVERIGLLPMFAAQFKALDADRSGRLESNELAPTFEVLRERFPLAAAPAAPANKELPAPWDTIDVNGDGNVDADELAAALRRIAPSLARWAPAILRAAD